MRDGARQVSVPAYSEGFLEIVVAKASPSPIDELEVVETDLAVETGAQMVHCWRVSARDQACRRSDAKTK
jgi:hypothetical protein